MPDNAEVDTKQSAAVEESKVLKAFKAEFAKLVKLKESPKQLSDPLVSSIAYNKWVKIGIELDKEIGTKQLLEQYGDLLKEARGILKKTIPKASLFDRLSTPIRLLIWCGVLFMACFQIILVLPVAVPIELVLKLIGSNRSLFNTLGYAFTRCTLAAMGIQIHVDPKFVRSPPPSKQGVIVTYNHTANIDPFATFTGCPPIGPAAFLGKKTLFIVPVFGWASLLVGNIPINRSGKAKAHKMVTEASKQAIVVKRRSVVIAPEGTRSWDGHLSVPMKKGTFHIQRATKAHIVPVAVYGAFELWPRGTLFTRTGELTIRHLEPLVYDESKTHDEVRWELQRRYLDALYPTTRAGVDSRPTFQKLSVIGALRWAVACIAECCVSVFLFVCMLTHSSMVSPQVPCCSCNVRPGICVHNDVTPLILPCGART